QLIDRESAEQGTPESLKLLDDALKLRPNNLLLLKEKGRVAAQLGDRKALEEVVATYKRIAPDWSGRGAADARRELDKLEKEAAGPLPGDVPFTISILNNNLQAEFKYVRDARELGLDTQIEGEAVEQFLLLKPMQPTPSAPDRDLTFEAA